MLATMAQRRSTRASTSQHLPQPYPTDKPILQKPFMPKGGCNMNENQTNHGLEQEHVNRADRPPEITRDCARHAFADQYDIKGGVDRPCGRTRHADRRATR